MFHRITSLFHNDEEQLYNKFIQLHLLRSEQSLMPLIQSVTRFFYHDLYRLWASQALPSNGSDVIWQKGVTPTTWWTVLVFPLSCEVPQGSVLCPLPFLLFMRPLGSIFRKRKISFHCFADDVQIYFWLKPNDPDSLQLFIVWVIWKPAGFKLSLSKWKWNWYCCLCVAALVWLLINWRPGIRICTLYSFRSSDVYSQYTPAVGRSLSLQHKAFSPKNIHETSLL